MDSSSEEIVSSSSSPTKRVHKKRGSNQQVVEESIKKPKTQENDDDEVEESNGDDDHDDYQEDSSEKRLLLERLKEFDKTKHKISRKIRERYVCHTCKMVFPTFHAVSCHVHDEKINNHNHLSSNSLSSPSPTTTTTVNDDNNKVGKLVINNFNDEHVKNNSESKFNKGVVVNDPPTIRRVLDFDLNELPHAEEDK
ncbi:uncharacterized protein LOC130939289 [Arachis stenosperma]|uniref:uncharacterized protein LOC130939289 n=1 Tax=Arachis stenosperma TaxID=217475 RepID=UPI0025AC4BCC|nr:uncharacterized protein LOC130939289 [Arachis stenosperma]